jgi:hypothetical protein
MEKERFGRSSVDGKIILKGILEKRSSGIVHIDLA